MHACIYVQNLYFMTRQPVFPIQLKFWSGTTAKIFNIYSSMTPLYRFQLMKHSWRLPFSFLLWSFWPAVISPFSAMFPHSVISISESTSGFTSKTFLTIYINKVSSYNLKYSQNNSTCHLRFSFWKYYPHMNTLFQQKKIKIPKFSMFFYVYIL